MKLLLRISMTGLLLLSLGLPALAGRGLAAGDAAPAVSLPGSDGATVTLVPAAGEKVTLLLFWASWSPRSLEALTYLKGLPAKYPPEKLALAAINADGQRMDAQRTKDVAAALEGTAYAGVSVIDPALEVFNAYGVIALPTFVVVGAAGKVDGFIAGFHFTAPEEVEEVLDRLIPREVARKSGDPRPVPPAPVARNGADVQFALAKEALRMGRTGEAIATLEVSVDRDPRFVESAVLLARLLRKEGRGSEADAVAARIRDLPLAHPAEIASAAAFMLDDGHAAEAKEALDGAVRLWPGDAVLLALRLAARLTVGDSPPEGEISAAASSASALPPEVARRLGLALAPRHPREGTTVLRAAIEGILATRSR